MNLNNYPHCLTSIVSVTDNAGYEASAVYDNYGAPPPAYTRRTGWLDRELDYETSPLSTKHKLYDLEARKYNASTGQFLSVDPLWMNYLSSGSYVYCTGDPVNKVDPWGLGEDLANPLTPGKRKHSGGLREIDLHGGFGPGSGGGGGGKFGGGSDDGPYVGGGGGFGRYRGGPDDGPDDGSAFIGPILPNKFNRTGSWVAPTDGVPTYQFNEVVVYGEREVGEPDLTNQFNRRVASIRNSFNAQRNIIDLVTWNPVIAYLARLLAFGYVQYRGVQTEFLNPKAFKKGAFDEGGYYKGEYLSADDFGNYAYGVAARSMGLLPIDAAQGAGLYSILSSSPTTDWTNFYGFFDEKKDTRMILRGFYGR